MSAGNRYLSPERFAKHLADLKIYHVGFGLRFLEFCERQRLLAPMARIRWPVALVLEGRNCESALSVTEEERRAAEALDDALARWNGLAYGAEETHPLDKGAYCPAADLVDFSPGTAAFQPWQEFRTNISSDPEFPLYVDDAVDTFYHGWQALLVADVLDMGAQVIFDDRRPDLNQLLFDGRLGDLPHDSRWFTWSAAGSRGLDQGTRWASYLDAIARFEGARSKALFDFSIADNGKRRFLKPEEQQEYRAIMTRVAQREANRIGASAASVVEFIQYLCRRWEDWLDRDRMTVASEYKHQIRLANTFAIHAFGISYSQLNDLVGHVGSGFKPTLEQIFPDWQKNAREQLELSLKHVVVTKAPKVSADYTLYDADIGDFLDWLERLDAWKIHLGVEEILKHQFSARAVDRAALAKEVEALSTTFEHMINKILEETGASPDGTLFKKLLRAFSSQNDIAGDISRNSHLVSTKPGTLRGTQLACIAALPESTANTGISRTLLAAILYRNDGQHNGMMTWPEAELHEATRTFLTALMFCRKIMLISPLSIQTARLAEHINA